MSSHKSKFYFFVTAAFIISIILRFPNLNRPLSKHHEFNMAMVLNVCNSWDIVGGPNKVHFCPLINYGNKGDIYYGNHVMVFNGKIYYLSFGPMQFLIAYYFQQILNNKSVYIIQILAILLSLLALVFLIKILILLKHKNIISTIEIYFGTILFLMHHSILWFFSNGYSHEVVILPIYLGIGYYFLKQFYSKATFKIWNRDNLFLFILYFLGVQTDWFILIVAFLHVTILIYNARLKCIYNASLFIGLPIILSMSILFYFYSKQVGFSFLQNNLLNKFESRTVGGSSDHASIFVEIKNFIFNFGISINLLLFSFLLLIYNKKGYSISPLFLFFFVPAIIYNIILFEFASRHDYAFLKLIPFFIFTTVVYLFRKFKKAESKFYIASAFCILFILQYFLFNLPGSKSIKGDEYNKEEKIASFITNHTNGNQVLFCTIKNINTAAVIYYCKRNIRFVSNNDESKFIAEQNNIQDYALISYNSENVLSIIK